MTGYNFVDLVVLVVLAYFVITGLRRGLLGGMADLVGMVIAFLIAIRGYAALSALLTQVGGIPTVLANFIALMGIFLVLEWLLGWASDRILSFAYRAILPGPLRVIDSVAGLLPGMTKGLLVASALVAFFELFPVNQSLSDQVRASPIGGRLAAGVGVVAPKLEPFLGGSAHDTALFITQPSESESPRRMDFPAGLPLREDQAAEERMLTLVNEERVNAGLKPLVTDPRLRDVALAHSEDMFRQSYFAHESPNGDTPADRVRNAGIGYFVTGENLAYAPSVEVAHTGLMNSPGHRRNILAASFGRVGIAVIDGGLYGKMFTQEFTN